MYLHVPVFLGAGWSVVTVWPDVSAALSPWALQLCIIGGQATPPSPSLRMVKSPTFPNLNEELSRVGRHGQVSEHDDTPYGH